MFKQDPGVDTSLCLSPSRTTRVGSKSTYKYPKRDPNWGYDAYKSLNYLHVTSYGQRLFCRRRGRQAHAADFTAEGA